MVILVLEILESRQEKNEKFYFGTTIFLFLNYRYL